VSSGAGCPDRLVCVPGGFQGPSSEQCGLSLLWAGGWTRGLLRCFHGLNDSVIIFLNRNITRAFSADLLGSEFTDIHKDTGVISLEQFLSMNWKSFSSLSPFSIMNFQ